MKTIILLTLLTGICNAMEEPPDKQEQEINALLRQYERAAQEHGLPTEHDKSDVVLTEEQRDLQEALADLYAYKITIIKRKIPVATQQEHLRCFQEMHPKWTHFFQTLNQ